MDETQEVIVKLKIIADLLTVQIKSLRFIENVLRFYVICSVIAAIIYIINLFLAATGL